ncbi:MAG: [Clostridia bacterium]|nr:[FeFe] hydrogenase, group A [Clostridia bacterium]
MENLVNVKINGISVAVPSGSTILDAAKKAGIRIPTLCYLRGLNEIGACRVCLVEVKGARSLVASCVYPVSEGMEVTTNSAKVIAARKQTLELLMSDHVENCPSCIRNGSCELQNLCHEYGIDQNKFEGVKHAPFVDDSSDYLVRDNGKCILCRRCIAACKEQNVEVIGPIKRGFETHIGCNFDKELQNVDCAACGQCINVCPTGALTEKSAIDDVINALNDKSKHVVVATAPSVRIAIGEEFGFPIGTNVEGKMVAALRRLGFAKVFDVDFTADLTIMEEATEFLGRVKNGGVLPMITSCSPGWIRFLEYHHPELIPNLSTCKSPQQMFGAVIKTYYAEKNNIDPKDIILVSSMPCTAKKFEITRDDQSENGVPDVDIVITTRETARLIKRFGVDFNNLEDEQFDNPLGVGSGAGLIFGATGGVMEAALRTAVETITGEELQKLDFTEVRGFDGIKEATYKVGDLELKVAVASGLNNANKICELIKSGKCDYHFIEIMCCPGGCLNGGGQPIVPADVRNFVDYKKLRAKAIYDTDKAMKLRKSHENPFVKQLYDEYFGHPNSHKAHEILHTSYVDRKI